MRKARFVFPFLFILFAANASAVSWQVSWRFCPTDFADVPATLVPVGCEIVDCCPGCPGPPELIDWHISVDKTVTRQVELRFDGIGAQALAALKLQGSARLDGDRIIAGPGESVVFGLAAKSERVPVAVVKPLLDEEKLRTVAAAPQKNDLDGGVQIVQQIGDSIVNRASLRYSLAGCPHDVQRNGPKASSRRDPFATCATSPVLDCIQLYNNNAGDNAVILADFGIGESIFFNDQVFRTSTYVYIGIATTPGEMSVFSDDNAMFFNPRALWTRSAFDINPASLQPILSVPVSIWIARAGATTNAANDIANANLLYNQNNAGVQFRATSNDVSGNPAAVAAIGGTAGDCSSAGTISGTAFYRANTLNVYYVNGAFTGVNCGVDRNVSYIGTIANIASLPHEIGHAYGLVPSAMGGHTNGLFGFGNNNVMWGGGPATRNSFSVGQAFRLNMHTLSQLNVNRNRVGPTRNCPPLTTDRGCPILAIDSIPH